MKGIVSETREEIKRWKQKRTKSIMSSKIKNENIQEKAAWKKMAETEPKGMNIKEGNRMKKIIIAVFLVIVDV